METMDRNIWNDIQSFKSELTNNVERSSTSNCTDPDDLICRFCNSDKLIYKEGNMICLKCGVDNANIIDCDAEWRFYGSDDNKQDPSRVGLPINPLLKTSSLGTCISGRTNNTIKRVHNYTMMTNEERGIWKELIVNQKTYLTILTFHPAYLLRQPDQKKHSWTDLKMIKKKIDELKINI